MFMLQYINWPEKSSGGQSTSSFVLLSYDAAVLWSLNKF